MLNITLSNEVKCGVPWRSIYGPLLFLLYRVFQKKCPIPKSLLNWMFCKIMDSNSNQRLIWDFRCASKSILFSYVSFCKQGGSSKCLLFKWLTHKNFKLKLNFFCTASKYGMLLLICKNFIQNDTW